MSITDSLIVLAVCMVGATFCAWQVRRALREPSERDQIVADARRCTADLTNTAPDEHDVGPDALRLLEDLDSHLDDYFAGLSHLFETLGPPPPWLVAAVRKEQQKGERP